MHGTAAFGASIQLFTDTFGKPPSTFFGDMASNPSVDVFDVRRAL
jgi:hypothetical protein